MASATGNTMLHGSPILLDDNTVPGVKYSPELEEIIPPSKFWNKVHYLVGLGWIVDEQPYQRTSSQFSFSTSSSTISHVEHNEESIFDTFPYRIS